MREVYVIKYIICKWYRDKQEKCYEEKASTYDTQCFWSEKEFECNKLPVHCPLA